MKAIISDLKDSFKISMDVYGPSQTEAKEVRNFFTNRHYTTSQINTLTVRGQPIETFNVVLMMVRALTGYLDTVANDPQVKARNFQSDTIANLINDYLQYTLERESFSRTKKKFQLDGMLSGLMVVYLDVQKTGEKDQYGRDIHDIKISQVPSWQVALDPMSKLDDYSDARYLHRWKWISEEEFVKTYGTAKLRKVKEYYNFLDDAEAADFASNYKSGHFNGKYRYHKAYLVCHTAMVDDNGKSWSIHWHDDIQLMKKEITYKEVQSPYRVVQMNDQMDEVEFYGPFREVVESQKAINQALIQVQLLVNTSKAFVETGAVDDIDKFKESFSRVNSVVEVDQLDGVKIEDMSRDVLDQYVIIDKAFDRIKSILGVNDSFLGQAFASDSGRKVQIQSAHAAGMLGYLTEKISYMIELIGKDLVALIKQYVSAEQVLRVTDPITGDRYFQVNQPLLVPEVDPRTGQPIINPQTNQPMMKPVYEPVVNPETGDWMEDDEGAIIMAPIGDPSSTLEFSDVDVIVESVSHDNSQEKDQLMLETVVNGPAGQFLLQTNPAGYAMVTALSLKNSGAKHASMIADVFQQTATLISQGKLDPTLAMLGGNPGVMGGALGGSNGNQVNGPSSQKLQIPTGIDQGGQR